MTTEKHAPAEDDQPARVEPGHDEPDRVAGQPHDLVAAFHAALIESEANEPSHQQLLAAQALIADAADRHHVEERAVVYLRLGPNGWHIDQPTFDGYSLAGYDVGPLIEACKHDDQDPDLTKECQALRQAAAVIDLPNAFQLTALLAAEAERHSAGER